MNPKKQNMRTAKLGDIVEISRNSLIPSAIASGTIYVGLENIGGDGSFSKVQKVSTGDLASSKFKFTEQHVLYGKLRPYLRKIARPTFAGICSTDILPLLPSPLVNRDFLFHYLRQDALINLANKMTTGANLPRLNPKALADFDISFPCITEQKRVAMILDTADALRATRRQALAQLDVLARSIFIEMFGDPVKNPKGWPMRKFEDVGILDRGVSKHRPRNAPELLGGKYPLIQTGDVANCNTYIQHYFATYSETGLRQSRLWPAGTLCITIAANIAKTGILAFDACFPDSIVGFQPNEACVTQYVRFWLSFLQKTLEANAPESAQKNINLAILRALDLPVPPITLQKEFAKRIDAIERLKTAQRTALAQNDALFAALQHRAFRGEL